MTDPCPPENGHAKQPLKLLLCAPRGFCAGVDRAIQIVILALKKYGAPVYVRHEIVHNRYVVDGLQSLGAVFVEELDEIPDTQAPVIFSAHGVPKSVPAEAQNRNFLYLDATCPLVSKVHKQAMRHERLGRHVLLIGHKGHPEVIGTMGQLPDGAVSLVETIEDAHTIAVPDESNLGYVTQTTLSVDDTVDILAALNTRFPEMVAPAAESICYATTNRQDAVKEAAPETDLFLIVGAPNSSNSKRLVEVARKGGAKQAMLVRGPEDLDWDIIGTPRIVALSAGASAPEILVNAIIDAFKAHFDVTVTLAETVKEREMFPVVKELRAVPLTSADMAFLNGEPS